jgi:superkiller protein 3
VSNQPHVDKFIKATELISAHQFEEAIQLFKELEDKFSSVPELYYNIAISYQHLSDYDEALDYAQNALELKPNNMTYLKLVAELSRNLNKIGIEIEALEKILGLEPDNLDIIHHLGFLHLKIDEMEKAVEYFQDAIEQNSSNSEVVFALAIMYYQSKREEKSIPLFKRLLSIKFRTDEVIDLLVNAYINLNQLEPAEELLLQQYESSQRTRFIKKIAKLYYKMDKLQEAENYIDQYLDKEPADLELKLLKAHILRERKENKDALQLYDEILGDNEKHTSAIKGKAMLLLEMGRIDEANELFERGQKLNNSV